VWGGPGYPNPTQIPNGTVVAVVDCFVNSLRVGKVVDEAIVNKDRLGIETIWLQLGSSMRTRPGAPPRRAWPL
jgi:uncharacterized protein